jgi:transcriptional regulator
MYIPPVYSVSDKRKLNAFMHEHSFAMLISNRDGTLIASHLPLLLDETRGEHGTLIGHMARANEQWKHISGEALAIFHGPHAYLSPTWYAEPGFVPTWDYIAVHAYGMVRLIDDPAQSQRLIQRIVDYFERAMPTPWKPNPPDQFQNLMKSIVAFEIDITRVQGQWKLSQNHTVERQTRVAAEMKKGDEAARAIAKLIEQNVRDKRTENA